MSREDLRRAALHVCLEIDADAEEQHLAASSDISRRRNKVPLADCVLPPCCSQDLRRIVGFCKHVQSASEPDAAREAPPQPSPLRNDVVVEGSNAELVLANAVRTSGGYFVLPEERAGATGRRSERDAERNSAAATEAGDASS